MCGVLIYFVSSMLFFLLLYFKLSCVEGWKGHNQYRMTLMELVFPTTTKKVIFLIFKELIFLNEMFFKILTYQT